MRESRLSGSVRGAVSDDRPYRDLISRFGLVIAAGMLNHQGHQELGVSLNALVFLVV